jgi:hypothetical protein
MNEIISKLDSQRQRYSCCSIMTQSDIIDQTKYGLKPIMLMMVMMMKMVMTENFNSPSYH